MVPEQNTLVPEQNTLVSEQNTFVPEQNTFVPEQNILVPEQNTEPFSLGNSSDTSIAANKFLNQQFKVLHNGGLRLENCYNHGQI